MRSLLHRLSDGLLRDTPLGLLPVRVKSGVAAGARWTLYPWTSYWRATHEPAVQAALMQLGHGNIRGWNCWDLGAHFGLYSVGLARRVGPTGQVAAFEPNPFSYTRLERHRKMNALTWLKTYQAAASNTTGHAELFTYGSLYSTTTHLPYEGETHSLATKPMPIRTLKLDECVQTGDLLPPNFVKIDVEGHGHRALAGMSETLRTARPLFLIAFHSQNEVEGVLNLLDPLHYERMEVGQAGKGSDRLIGRDYLFTPPA
jgi:FkbM family methyltransferase